MTPAPIVTVAGLGSFTWSKHHSLLDALESAGIDINYSCRAGVCAACRVTLLEGKVHWRNEPMLSLHPNEVLACSVLPLTDITIKID